MQFSCPPLEGTLTKGKWKIALCLIYCFLLQQTTSTLETLGDFSALVPHFTVEKVTSTAQKSMLQDDRVN